MKKLLTIFVLMVGIGAASTCAQVKWNVEAQTGLSAITTMPNKNRCGLAWSAGVGASIPLSSVVHVAPSLLFSQRGAKIEGYYGSEMIMPAKYSIRTNYLELPVYLSLHFGSKENLRFIIKTGPSFNYGLTGKVKVSMKDSDFSTTYPENLFSQSCDLDGVGQTFKGKKFSVPKFNLFDLLWCTGFDVMFEKHYIIGANVKVGLTNATTEPISGNAFDQLASLLILGNANSRNVSISINAAYQF